MIAGSHALQKASIVVLSVATVIMFVVSVRANYLYGHEVGQSDEKRMLFAWANVAADIWKAFGLVAVTMLLRARHYLIAVVGSLAWLTCLFAGINSALSVYVLDRSTITDARSAKHANYRQAERDLAEVESRRNKFAAARAVAEIDAHVLAVLAQPVVVQHRVRGTIGTLSNNCTLVDVRTAEACAAVARLRSERASSVEASRLDDRAIELRVTLARLREQGSAAIPDPVSEFYAWATRGLLTVRDVSFGFPRFFALMIEVVTALGPVTIARAVADGGMSSRVETRPGMSRHVVTPSLALVANDHVDEQVAAWMSDRATPAHASYSQPLKVLYDDFVSWCASTTIDHCDAQSFAVAFERLCKMPELANNIRRVGDSYHGIRLSERTHARS